MIFFRIRAHSTVICRLPKFPEEHIHVNFYYRSSPVLFYVHVKTDS